jgi:ADP-specific Phosphofructokinase/Glucokinase conserved region
MKAQSWLEQYTTVLSELPTVAERSPLTLCGLGTCVDAYVRLSKATALFEPDVPKEAALLAAELIRRTERGAGGEYRIIWPEAEGWILGNLSILGWGLGGTGAQVAQALVMLGAQALMSLEDRSVQQLSVVHPDILIADASGLKRCGDTTPRLPSKPPHCVFEVAAGERVGPIVAQRSTRIIVRFIDEHLDRDPDFARESIKCAGGAASAVICGFNELGDQYLDQELANTCSLLNEWRRQGLSLIHLELGGYENTVARDKVFSTLGPFITSLGMSHSELREFGPQAEIEAVSKLRARFDLDRVCIHADEWALSVTRNDPENELKSLIGGSLLAACRAERGLTCVPARIPPLAEFLEPPWPAITQDGQISIVCCATPYLTHPTATIGLGDTFLAGTLLILGDTSYSLSLSRLSSRGRGTMAVKPVTETPTYDQYTEHH